MVLVPLQLWWDNDLTVLLEKLNHEVVIIIKIIKVVIKKDLKASNLFNNWITEKKEVETNLMTLLAN